MPAASEQPASPQPSPAVPTEAPSRKRLPKASDPKPKILPPYRLILLNDDDHTYEYVVRLLIKVFRMDLKRAFRLTRIIDRRGRAAVWTGTKELAELKQQQVRGFGPDIYAAITVNYPLGCVIEPVPQ